MVGYKAFMDNIVIKSSRKLRDLLRSIFSIKDSNYFDFRFAKLIKSNAFARAIFKIKQIKEKSQNFVVKRYCESLIFALRLFKKFQQSLQLIFEKKLLKHKDQFGAYCKSLSAYFNKLSLANNTDLSFASLSQTMFNLSFLDDEHNPISMTITVSYAIWYLINKYEINTEAKFLAFIDKLNGSILTYVNSLSSYYDVLQFIESEIIFN